MKKESQKQRILSHLQSGCSITALEALDLFGCFRLAARIGELRKMGYQIITGKGFSNGKKYAKYYMQWN